MAPKNKSYFVYMVLSAAASMLPAQAQGLFRVVSSPTDLKTSPGYSAAAPSGFSASAGTAFFGIGGTSRENADTLDGGFAFGATYGNSDQFLGGAVSISVPSLKTDSGFMEKGGLSASVGHNFEAYAAGISVGVAGVDIWRKRHAPKEDPSYYIAASKAFDFALPTFATIGIGTNIFANKDSMGYKRDRAGVFGSVGVYVHPQMSLIVDRTGGRTTLSTGLVPMPDYPVSVSLGVVNDDETDKAVLVVGVGVAFPY